ncbi:serine/threonine-protein kinase [Streptomyces sp. NPDC091272]|uniref:serine/threonine-protein kinase n=1 Tax=Streptomyces sp. NPDC091272 TaxID=3365981 RepID=UPI0037FA9E82
MESLRPRQDPATIGAYVLLARLGAGGMGQVYLGRSPGGRLVAIKVIRDEITEHPEALARFRREANTVRAVRSAYTANLIDAALDAPPYWLATEYVRGPTLAHAVRERGAFPAHTGRGLFAALAEGLASVHAYDVTHRDLKPMNVILGGQGPQLIDFGIAKGAGDTALTMTGMTPGTPGFTAPEVLIRNQVGPEADVFALGATVAYAVTGRPPFGSGPTDAVSYRAVHEPIDLVGLADAGLAGLLRACVEKDPVDRPTPEEVIRRCEVRGALVDDPFYGGVVRGLEENVPEAPDVLQLHERATEGPGAPGAGYVPTLGPVGGTTATTGGRRRARPWVVAGAVAAVVGVSVATTLWLQRDPGGGDGGTGGSAGGGGGKQTVGAPTPGAGNKQTQGAGEQPKGEAPAGPPQHIEQTAPAVNWWNAVTGECELPTPEEGPTQFQHSVTIHEDDSYPPVPEGKARIAYRLKYAVEGAEPYYVAVTVKPVKVSGTTNTDIGAVSKVLDLHAGGAETFKEFVYPDDFTRRADGKELAAPPLSSYRGEWTVEFQHVRAAKSFKSFVCAGFLSL